VPCEEESVWGWSEAASFAAGILATTTTVWQRSRILSRRKADVVIPELDEETERSIRSRVAEVAGHAGNPIGGSLAAAAIIDRERRQAGLRGRCAEPKPRGRWHRR
jgi:hypothetical protein